MREMTKAKTFYELGERADFYRGYMRGLRRRYYGDNFGEPGEHEKWLALVDDDYREERCASWREERFHGCSTPVPAPLPQARSLGGSTRTSM